MKIELSSEAFLGWGIYSGLSIRVTEKKSRRSFPGPVCLPKPPALCLSWTIQDAPLGTFIHWVLFNIEPTQSSFARRFFSKQRIPWDKY